nr:MAG TPA: hypothetical protein [Caudoviricetes sp.]
MTLLLKSATRLQLSIFNTLYKLYIIFYNDIKKL